MVSSDRAAILGYGYDLDTTILEAVDLAASRIANPENAASENLLRNGSFETADGWTVGHGWTVPQAVDDAYHEDACARLIADGNGGELISEPVTLEVADQSYFFSWVSRMVSFSHGLAQVLVRGYNAAGEMTDEFLIAEYGDEAPFLWTGASQQFAPVMEEERDLEMPEEVVNARFVFRAAAGAVLVWEVDAAQITRGWLDVTFAPAPNENIDGSAILPGTVPAEAFDVTPPAVPTGLALASDAIMSADGIAITRVYATLLHPTDSDYIGCEVQITGDYTQPDLGDPATRSPLWAWARTLSLPKDGDRVVLEPAVGGDPYWARARSLDATGNRSAFSDTVLLPAAKDAAAPPIPAIAQTIPGYRLVGVYWLPVAANDVGHYEVRYRQPPKVVVSETGTTVTVYEWTSMRTKATAAVIGDLETTDDGVNPDDPLDVAYHNYTYYTFQVRSVDRSGNTKQGRTQALVVTVDASAGASVVTVADARGLLSGANILFPGDATVYNLHSISMLGDDIAGDLTITPVLVDPLAVGDAGMATYTSDTPVIADDEPYAGWSAIAVDAPTLVGRPDIAANSILANMIAALQITSDHIQSNTIKAEHIISGQINSYHVATTGLLAEQIKAGTLTLGGPDPLDPLDPAQRTNPDTLLVLNLAGDPILKIGTLRGADSTPPGFDVLLENFGLLLLDPEHPSRRVSWIDGVLSFTEDNWEHVGVAIDGRGVVADSILVGQAPGGHNAIPNPSLERTGVIGAPTPWTVTTNAHWDNHLTGANAPININDASSADTLQMTDVTY